MHRFGIVATILFASLQAQLIAAPADLRPPSAEDVAGIWKVCFEPGLPGVKEPDGGYLVLMPDSRFYEIVEGCCRERDEPPIVGRLGSYSIEGDTIVLHLTDSNGKPHEQQLKFLRATTAVTFDDLKGSPVHGLALQAGPNLNYGYVKVFWNDGWWR